MNAAGHPTRCRPDYREPADNCCLLGASSLKLATCALLSALYTGAKELSYPACRRLEVPQGLHGRSLPVVQGKFLGSVRARHNVFATWQSGHFSWRRFRALLSVVVATASSHKM